MFSHYSCSLQKMFFFKFERMQVKIDAYFLFNKRCYSRINAKNLVAKLEKPE